MSCVLHLSNAKYDQNKGGKSDYNQSGILDSILGSIFWKECSWINDLEIILYMKLLKELRVFRKEEKISEGYNDGV